MNNSFFVVAEYVKSSQNSTGYFWERLIDHLENVGLDIEVISNAGDGEYYRSQSVFVRFFTKIIGALKLGIGVVRSVKRNSLLMSGTNPEFLMLVLAFLKIFIGYRWVVVVSDIFPDNTIPAHILPEKSLRYYIISMVFRFAYRNVDHFIVPGRDMAEVVNKKINSRNKISYIPYWVDIDNIIASRKSMSPIVDKLGWQDKTVFQFFGNMGVLQDINNILSAIKLTSGDKLAFLFIGSGTEKKSVEKFIIENPSKSVCYYGDIPQDQKNVGLCACDVAIVSLIPGMKGLAVPSKAFFSFAADKPVLFVGDVNSELSMIVQENKVGWSCVPGNPKALADAFEMIAAVDLSQYCGSPRKLAEEKNAEILVLNDFHRLIVKMIK